MDHQEIEAHDWVGRYIRHELTEEETAAFEEHLMTCGRCMDEVESDQRFGATLVALSEEGRLPEAGSPVAGSPVAGIPEAGSPVAGSPVAGSPVAGTLERRPAASRRLHLAWAASVLIALLPAWLLYRQGGELEHRLLAQQEAAAVEKQRYDSRIGQLEEELDAAQQQIAESSSAVPEATAQAEDSARNVLRLEERLRRATRPRSGAPVLHLAPTRSTAGEAAHRLTLTDREEWVILMLEPSGFAERFDLELIAPDGSFLLREKGLEVDGYGSLTVTIYSPDLNQGVHRLRLLPSDGSGAQDMSLEVMRSR